LRSKQIEDHLIFNLFSSRLFLFEDWLIWRFGDWLNWKFEDSLI